MMANSSFWSCSFLAFVSSLQNSKLKEQKERETRGIYVNSIHFLLNEAIRIDLAERKFSICLSFYLASFARFHQIILSCHFVIKETNMQHIMQHCFDQDYHIKSRRNCRKISRLNRNQQQPVSTHGKTITKCNHKILQNLRVRFIQRVREISSLGS